MKRIRRLKACYACARPHRTRSSTRMHAYTIDQCNTNHQFVCKSSLSSFLNKVNKQAQKDLCFAITQYILWYKRTITLSITNAPLDSFDSLAFSVQHTVSHTHTHTRPRNVCTPQTGLQFIKSVYSVYYNDDWKHVIILTTRKKKNSTEESNRVSLISLFLTLSLST